MELRYLKYFVAVAETKHFTRAAERLGIAQPPLSQQIKKLEHEVGAPLFIRLTRGVELTPAGETLYPHAVRILSSVDEAVNKVQQVARGEINKIKLGFATSTGMLEKVLTLVHRFQSRHPDIQIIPSEVPMPQLVDNLLDKQVDIAFLRLPCYASEKLEKWELFDDPFVAVLPESNPLSHHHQLSLHQLKDQELVVFPRETGPGLFDALHQALDNFDIKPKSNISAPQLRATVSMALAGIGIALVPQSLTEHLSGHSRIIPVSDMPLSSRVVLSWNKTSLSEPVRQFIALSKSYGIA
ncbi:LysR family transcriptional regulator [Vibrio quintilis]|uniref:Hca operon transcriptional activator n=1 Tax=Vibrio quintilis TaxID=1117707 RepID=A0A1M7YW09_9VIBR|nr:LysR family transcriptional regulator [Vibrio quintilis]SHO56753.1 Hca operon transcriptional activator [Vibrio quintilis]